MGYRAWMGSNYRLILYNIQFIEYYKELITYLVVYYYSYITIYYYKYLVI